MAREGAYTSNHIQSYTFKAPASKYYNESAYIYTDLASTANPNSTYTLEPQHQILLLIHLTPLEPQHQILLLIHLTPLEPQHQILLLIHLTPL